MTTRPIDTIRPEFVSWGTVNFKADEVQDRMQDAADRSRRVNHLISDFSGGLALSSRIYTLDEMLKSGEYSVNTGLITHIPGVLALGWKITAASVISGDFSTYRTTNKRVHSADWNGRFVACVGPYLIKDTSTSNPVLIQPSTNDNISDNVGAITVGYFADTRYFAIGAMDGTTDGIKGTTDPLANDITWASIFGYTSGDSCWGMHYIQALGITVLYGKFGGISQLGYLRDTDPLLTQPTPFDLSTSVSPTTNTYSTNQTFPGAAVTNNTGIGSISWTNPDNARNLSNADPASESFATVSLSDDSVTGEISNYLYADTFGFALQSTDVVTGVEVMVWAKATTPGGGGDIADMEYNSVRLFDDNAALVGDNQASAFPNIAGAADLVTTAVFGGQTSLWGVALTPTIVNDADFGVGVSMRKNGVTGTASTVSVAAIAMTVWYQRGLTLMSTTKSAAGNYTQRTSQSGYFATTLSPVTASDNSDTRVTWQTGGGADDNSTELWLTNWGFALPSNAVISGIVVGIERAETDAAANADDTIVQLLVSHTATGDNKQQADNLEYPTSDTVAYYGGPGDGWGITPTATIINNPGFGLRYQLNLDSNAVDIDHVSITVYWYMPISTLSLPLGGFMMHNPANSYQFAIIAPEADATTTITGRRHLYLLNLSTTTLGVATLSEADTGIGNVRDCWPHQGGFMVLGDLSSSTGTSTLKHIDSSGTVRSYRVPTNLDPTGSPLTPFHGVSLGIANLVETINGVPDAQWVLEYNGTFHPEYGYNSVAQTMDDLPIERGERLVSSQRQIYRFYSMGSGTALGYTYAFVPRDIFSDPITTNSTQARGTGSFYVTGVKFLLGDGENENTLNFVKYLNDQVSATTAGQSYGSVKMDIETGIDGTAIDTSFATPTITTGALTTAFAEYKVPTNGEAGRAAMLRITLANAAATSTKTPSGLPWYIGGVSYAPALSTWYVYPAMDEVMKQHQSWGAFVNTLKTLAATKRTQTFKWGNISKTAALVGWDGKWVVPEQSKQVTRTGSQRPVLIFEEQRGTV